MKELKASGIDHPGQAGFLTVDKEKSMAARTTRRFDSATAVGHNGLLCRALFCIKEQPGTW